MTLGPLGRFSLDLDGLRVTGVDVDAERAAFARGKGKLTITPPPGKTFTRCFNTGSLNRESHDH